jgi:hypothetical protein
MLNYYLSIAAHHDQKSLIDLFIEYGADDMNLGMQSAVVGGHIKLVKFFIEHGANDLKRGLYLATQGKHQHIIDFFQNIIV